MASEEFARSAPIGVFDSGLGGLSVLQHIRQTLPNEALVYVADSGFSPYGDKTSAEILERSIAVTDFLLSKKIKALVVACNTATAAAIKHLRLHYPDLIIVGIEPGLKPASLLSKTKKVGVLATLSTIQSEKYHRLSTQLSAETAVEFIPQACVGLVDQIEKTEANAAHTRLLLKGYLNPLLDAKVDTLVLGCTHYPFVAKLIQELTSAHIPDRDPITLIDTGKAVASQLQRLLAERDLTSSNSDTPHINAYTNGNPEKLKHACTHWISMPEDNLSVSSFST
ncbi:glutamate racemase [Undibacterium sp.]|uniref:glutamate racemase n=1 Tax=Undibacterium sp. TaxID=1914977 RepID=UPI00272F3FD7|nr:glutamate racemase [Undibacterium sp.]MDP1978230.1 glutamate racemase [Undibacterium sp.]